MFNQPWFDINDYPKGHDKTLLDELKKEIPEDHILHGIDFEILARRQDQDDILIIAQNDYFIVHLTWTGHQETNPYPRTAQYKTLESLKDKLLEDAAEF